MAERYEAGSQQWIDALGRALDEALVGVDLTGVQVAFYEECLNPPAHLLAEGESSVAWSVEIDEDGGRVSRGRIADPDLFLEADYTAVLGLAHLPISDPELGRLMADLAAQGLLRRGGDGSKMPPHVGAAWGKVHDLMTERTL
jgi:hypothetical protein